MSDTSRRRRVEHGLSAALQIAGRPVEHHTLVDRMVRYAVPGVALAVVDDGEVAWAAGYGQLGGGRGAVAPTSLFQAASISKAVAAVGALALVERGVIGLDDDVNRHLRSWRFPASELTTEQPVTVRRLLSHTAGTTVPGFPGYPMGVALPSVAEVLSGTGSANTPAVESFAVPGTVAQYSGGGTTVVQQLICDVTGREFGDLMDELVLRPFGMADSAYQQPLAAARLPLAAWAHDSSGAPVPDGCHVYPEVQAAGLWTTAVDLARWVIGVQQVLRGERSGPISRGTALEMVTGVGVGPFGLGPELAGEGRLWRFMHSGGNEGFKTWVDGLVELPTGAAVLTNGDGGSTLCVEIRRAIAAEYGWGEIGAPPIELAAVDPALLQSYVGRYVGPYDRPMKLELADGELFSPAPYGRRRMLPLGDTTFLDEETGAMLEIERRDGGAARIAVLVDGIELMAFTPKEDQQ